MKNVFIAVIFMLFCSSAFAWNCSNPLAERVLVPSNTQGTYGDGDGQLALFNGQVYECEVVKPSKPTPDPTVNSNTNSNSNSNSNNNTLNQTQSQTQEQKQKQDQFQSSTNNNQSAGGSVSDVGNNQTLVEAPKIPVNSAYAPTTIPSAPCVKGFGAGVQTMPIGGSFGGNKIDEGCDARETARSYALLGSRVAACKVLINTKQSRKAGVTMDDCLHVVVPPAVQAPVIVPPPAPTVVVVPVQLPSPPEYKTEVTVVAPKPVVKKRAKHLPPDCQNVVQRVCKTKEKQ